MASKSLWAKIGLAKPEHRAWAMYDWANSAFMTVVISALFPPFFIRYAAGNSCTNTDTFTQLMNATLAPFGPKMCAWAPQVPNATMYLGFGSALALAICAFLSPALGAHIDHRPVRRKWLFAMTLIGCACAGLLALTERGDWLWAIAVFAVGQIAVNMAFVIYDGFLQHVAAPEELDRVSTAGYAIGYVGGGILLLINAMMILSPTTFGLANAGQATKASFISVGVWWLLFSIPFFRGVKEPPATPSATRVVWWKQVVTSARALHKYPHAFAMLVAFLVYNDGIGTMLRMSTAYGEEIGLAMGDMILALILVQFIGIPATFLFGAISRWVGTKRAILGGLVIYGCVTFAAYFITTAAHFYALAICIGLVQGGTQSLSRALFASMIPKDRSSEFFGVFAVFERFAGIFGPLTMGVAIALFGGSRPAILSIGLFFVIGFWLLTRVDIEAGRAHAQQNAAGLSPHAMPLAQRKCLMKLCIKDEPHFTNDLSAMLWAFITGRLSLTDFELFLYANIDGLSAVFTNEALAELLEQDYRALPPARLRQDLKDALQEYELPCECPKIPTTAALDIGFLRCIDDSVSLIDYVNQRILRTFSLKGTERRVHGYWELRRNGGTEVCFFQDGNVYKCQQCETPWLVILDESTVAYLFLELAVNDSIAISDLHSRLAQELGYRPTSLLPPLSMTREESQ